MDIDDILREVDPTFDTIPQETRDLQALTRAWVAERCAPELLECATPFLPLLPNSSSRGCATDSSNAMACLQMAHRWAVRGHQPAHQNTDREGRRHDGRHGPQDQFRPYRDPDGARAIQVHCSQLSPRQDSKGELPSDCFRCTCRVLQRCALTPCHAD